MAYYGGTATARPFPRVSKSDVILATLMTVFCGAGVLSWMVLRQAPVVQAPVQLQEAAVAPPLAPVTVFVARDNIWPGQRLQPAFFKVETRDSAQIDDGILTDANEIQGKYAAAVIPAGTELRASFLGVKPQEGSITGQIPERYRAVSIKVDPETGVEGWARPGARVDVTWVSERRGRQLIATIVENAQVISAASSMQVDEANPNAELPQFITLMMPLGDAQKVQLAKHYGLLSLSLRGDTDVARMGGETMTIDSMMSSVEQSEEEGPRNKVAFDGKEFVVGRGGVLVDASVVAAQRAAEKEKRETKAKELNQKR